MTIRGDNEARLVRQIREGAPPRQMVDDIFDWMVAADVITTLSGKGGFSTEEITAFCNCADWLRDYLK